MTFTTRKNNAFPGCLLEGGVALQQSYGREWIEKFICENSLDVNPPHICRNFLTGGFGEKFFLQRDKYRMNLKKILSFDSFLTEAVYKINSEEIWPRDWKRLPQWSVLQELGFEDATPDKMRENGNILLMNPQIPEYPAGVVLQQSGYIRNKAVTSGFIKKFSGEYRLTDMFDYLITKFEKLRKRLESKPERIEPRVSTSTTRLLDKIVFGPESNWRVNSDGRVDVQGDVLIVKNIRIPKDLFFGKVTGDFVCTGCNLLTLENFGPEEVGGKFDCSNNKLNSFAGFPKKIGSKILVLGDNEFSSFEGFAGLSLDYLDILIIDNNRFTSLKGCPTVTGRLSCRSNYLKNLEGIISNSVTTSVIINIELNPLEDLKDLQACKYVTTTEFNFSNFKNPESFYQLLEGLDVLAFSSNRTEDRSRGRISDGLFIDSDKRGYEKKIVSIAVNSLSQEQLDDFYSKKPQLLYQLDDFPKLKKGILERTGVKDVGGAYRSLRSGII